MASLAARYESFIAWRYLFRRRNSAAVLALTALSGLVAALALLAVFAAHGRTQLVGVSVALPAMIFFVFFALLNLFSGFTAVSIVGVAIGVLALGSLVTLSVTSGFQQAFKLKVLGANAHVDVMKSGDFSDYRDVQKKMLTEKHVVAAAPFVLYEAMLSAGRSMSGSEIKGIDPEQGPKVIELRQWIRSGAIEDLGKRLRPNDGGEPLPAIFIGQELAKKLKLKVGDRVSVVSPQMMLDFARGRHDDATPTARPFRVAGTFYVGFEEYDSRLSVISLSEAQRFYGRGDVVTGVELRLDEIDDARAVANKIYEDLGGAPFHAVDWETLNHNLFAALRTQKVAITLILTVIIIVAAFNIIAAMTMLVIGKSQEIAILKSMGMRSTGVARVFQTAGILIGAAGTACGMAIGLITIAVLRRYDYQLDPHVYLIDQLPVKVNVDELILTACIALAICLLATLYPAMRAARLPPVDGLRYE